MKTYEVVVFGATGFTGRLVIDALVARYSRRVRLAIAGRDRDKLERVAEELQARYPGAPRVGILRADSADRASLGMLARSATTICSTVGPYARYGDSLLEICAQTGTHYCDLSGEIAFMRTAIDRHDHLARASRARIVQAAGFDSVPSDVGVYMLHQHFAARGKQLASARARFNLHAVGLSGGTMSSMLGLLEDLARDPRMREQALDPYGLVPGRRRRGPDGLDRVGVRYERRFGGWTGPFIMAPVNTRIVRRTNALLGEAYGRDFRYEEACAFGHGPGAAAQAFGASAQLLGLVGLGAVAPGRALLARLGPKPGEGPSQAVRASSSFELIVQGEGDGLTAEASVTGGDPGYGETAKMISEVAVALACDGDRLPARFGVLTPVAALEGRLIERLRAVGIGLAIRGAELTLPASRRPAPATCLVQPTR
jgi:short subunit dehydrogenase-like uncharacterized protein